MSNEKNIAAVGSLTETFKQAPSVYLVNYQGCTCKDLNGLRSNLKPSGAKFAVVKNTLAKIAIGDSHAEGLAEFFKGPTAVIWADSDPVSPAKLLTDFAKEQESFEIKAGVVDGNLVDVAGIKALASLPSKEELFAKLLALINAPATQLLRTIKEPSAQVARLLGALRDELEKKN